MRGFLPAGFALFAALALFDANTASADVTFQTLYNFTGGSDGAGPQSGLVMDTAGNLYGTTPQGGASNMGTLFKLAPDGTFTLLHAFTGGPHDGNAPTGSPLTLGAHGTIYGMTINGGTTDGGTVYRFKDGKMKVLHSFGVGTDGFWPYGGLLLQPDGSLVGTTREGGAGCEGFQGCGAVFSIAPDGAETILYAFAGPTDDGAGPRGTPVRDLAGNLYGTTSAGGPVRDGTVYKISPDGTETVLYGFTTIPGDPIQGLAIDNHGNLFGSTYHAVYEIDNSGKASAVLKFSNQIYPGITGLLPDKKGNLYGTFAYGGSITCSCGEFFVIDPRTQQFTVLHAFGGSDGQNPYSGVITDGHGNFYGTTMRGGANNVGTIFKISVMTK